MISVKLVSTSSRAALAAAALALGLPAAAGADSRPEQPPASTPDAGSGSAPASSGRKPPGDSPASGTSATADPNADPMKDRREREQAARALERALREQGGLLLPEWGVEVVPELGWAHQDVDALVQAEGGPVGAEARSNLLQGVVAVRLGLPYDLQLEAAAPFVHAQRDVTVANAFVRADEENGLGDVQAALTWQLARGASRAPDVLLSARWKSRTGRSPFSSRDAIGLGSGLDELAASVTLVKPVDPLVLLASAEVAHPFARRTPIGHVDAREAFAFSIAAVLAVSPEASITFGVDQRIAPRMLLNGAPVPGTDQLESSFRLGLSTAWSATGSLQVNLAMGLTRDVPQVQLSVATPLQF